MPANPPAFGELLKHHRRAAGLSQEALAERAGISLDAVRALERGRSGAPRAETLARLATALGLEDEARAALTAAAWPQMTMPVPADPPAAATTAVATEPAGRQGTGPHLPAALSSFVGREAERAAVRGLLERARLVTLTGAGGVGKTRLALAVAEELAAAYRDGACLVELAALAEPALVPAAVAAALGLREEPGRPHLDTLIAFLQARQAMLVLDNCEHLLAACAALAAALLRACPDLHILATSREALGLSGEQRYRVPSLSVPDPHHLPAAELVPAYEAVRLFVARAQERQADFALDARTAPLVARICARLDGIPLAIELAAARVGVLDVAAIAARLDDRFRLLTGGPHDVLPRQRTLRATLDWSYGLLSESEQALLDRLSVFAGGCTLAAAEAVCSGDGVREGRPGESLDVSRVGEWQVLDLLASLVDKSLVQASGVGEKVRYSLLETVRQYGEERLTAVAAADTVRDRHLDWCLALAEEAEPRLRGPEQAFWLVRLDVEHDNLRSALRWTVHEAGSPASGLQLANLLWRFWSTHGDLSEGRTWLREALARGASAPAAVRAGALAAEAALSSYQGDFGQAKTLLDESLILYREMGSREGIARVLNNLGQVAMGQNEYERAANLWEQSLSLFRELADKQGMASSLVNLARLAEYQSDAARERTLAEEGLALYRELGDSAGIAVALSNLGNAAKDQGDYAQARTLLEESLILHRELGNQRGIAYALTNLAQVARWQGDYERAGVLEEQSLALWRELGHSLGVACSLANLGLVAVQQREYQRGRQSLEESLALFRDLGDMLGVAYALTNLGMLAGREGDFERAKALLQEGLTLQRTIGNRISIAESLQALATVLQAQQRPERAARLVGAVEALRRALGAPRPPTDQAACDQLLIMLRAALDEEAFAAAWAEGQAMSLEAAISLALEGHAEEARGVTRVDGQSQEGVEGAHR